MFRPFSLYVGLRYTSAKRNNNFISFISLVSMLGLMLGVAALIVVLSVMNGFDRELKERILGMVPHGTISDYGTPLENWQAVAEKVNQQPGVIGTAPYIQAQGMLTNRGVVRGVLINGIEPELEQKISILDNHIKAGSLDALQPKSYGIVLGSLLARSM